MNGQQQLDLFETAETRSLLDKLLSDSRLYKKSKHYKELLDFVVRMRNFAPFNAMLLEVQKPGLSHAASAKDWQERFGRYPKEGARPLLIMWPFGPVALVYDVLDTDGPGPAPSVFTATGAIDDERMASFPPLLAKVRIDWHWMDQGDYCAGSIRIVERREDCSNSYRMNVNKNHSTPVQFSTLTHELGHLLMGHLGADTKLKIQDRSWLTKEIRELEAESVSYIVCSRNGIEPRAEVYLNGYVTEKTEVDDIDVYGIMTAAGKIESMLKIAATTRFERPPATRR